MESDLRKKLAEAMWEERRKKVAFYHARGQCENIATEYYSAVYNVADGGIVYMADTGQEIQLAAFIQWTDDLDARPGVLGRLKHAFGWDKKTKMFKSHEWQTEAEMEGEG